MGSEFAGAPSWGLTDFGAAPVLSSPLLEELLPVLDFPQSQESLLELSSVLSLSSHPDDDVLEDEDDVVDDEEEEDDDVEEEDEDVDDVLLEEDELEEELVELEPQLSPLVSLVVGLSVPVDEVPPQPSSATGASSPVSS